MTLQPIIPSSRRLRIRITLAATLAVVGASAYIAGTELGAESSTVIIPMATPVPIVQASPSVKAPVTIVIAPPAPPIVEEKPAPEPRMRGLAPWIDPDCLVGETEPSPACSWDDGFPAISEDGSLIAVRDEDYDADGLAAYEIQFFDTRASQLVRTRSLVSMADAWVLSPNNEESTHEEREAMRRRIESRVAAAQRDLVEGHFRAMEFLGTASTDREDGTRGTGDVYADFAKMADRTGAVARIVDAKTSSVLWRGRFTEPRPDKPSIEEDCGGWNFWSISLWWDPITSHALSNTLYRRGGCMCGAGDHISRVTTMFPERQSRTSSEP